MGARRAGGVSVHLRRVLVCEPPKSPIPGTVPGLGCGMRKGPPGAASLPLLRRRPSGEGPVSGLLVAWMSRVRTWWWGGMSRE